MEYNMVRCVFFLSFYLVNIELRIARYSFLFIPLVCIHICIFCCIVLDGSVDFLWKENSIMNIKLHSCEYVVEFNLKNVYKSNWISVENFYTLLRMFCVNVWSYFHAVLSTATATATATAITANSATPTIALLTILMVAFEYVFLYIQIATSYKIRLLKLLDERNCAVTSQSHNKSNKKKLRKVYRQRMRICQLSLKCFCFLIISWTLVCPMTTPCTAWFIHSSSFGKFNFYFHIANNLSYTTFIATFP